MMEKQFFPPLVVAIAAVLVFATGELCSAMPSYARQSGVSCFDCHSKTITPLEAMKPATEDTSVAYSVPVMPGVGAGFSITASDTNNFRLVSF